MTGAGSHSTAGCMNGTSDGIILSIDLGGRERGGRVRAVRAGKEPSPQGVPFPLL